MKRTPCFLHIACCYVVLVIRSRLSGAVAPEPRRDTLLKFDCVTGCSFGMRDETPVTETRTVSRQAHVYRGAFGAHVSMVLRRLLRLWSVNAHPGPPPQVCYGAATKDISKGAYIGSVERRKLGVTNFHVFSLISSMWTPRASGLSRCPGQRRCLPLAGCVPFSWTARHNRSTGLRSVELCSGARAWRSGAQMYVPFFHGRPGERARPE